MTLREALKEKGWEYFDIQHEIYNASCLLIECQEGESANWLDAEASAGSDYIVDAQGDTLREHVINEIEIGE